MLSFGPIGPIFYICEHGLFALHHHNPSTPEREDATYAFSYEARYLLRLNDLRI